MGNVYKSISGLIFLFLNYLILKVRMLATFNSPFVVKYIDSFLDGGCLNIIMVCLFSCIYFHNEPNLSTAFSHYYLLSAGILPKW